MTTFDRHDCAIPGCTETALYGFRVTRQNAGVWACRTHRDEVERRLDAPLQDEAKPSQGSLL